MGVKKHHKHEHHKLPKETPAFFCANCGAVSLDAGSICKVGGTWRRADWCGIKDPTPPRGCVNRVHNVRWVCGKCGKVAVNPGLLCRPEEMPKP